MSARQKFSLLERTAIHGVVEEISANAAVVEERISLSWGAIADDGFAIAFSLDEKFKKAAFGFADMFRERRSRTPRG